MQQAQVTQAELLPALDAVLAEMTRRSQEAPDPGENRLSDWRDFAWLVCSAIGKCGILTPRDLWLRRLTVVAATADGQVDYYERLVATNGSAWANGLRRAKQFRALVKGNDCSLEALSALILALEREYRSEGTAFWWMLAQAQWAAEPLLDTAV